MTYRDDLEAALARVRSLEQALDAERRDDAAQAARIAELEAELAAARERLIAAEAKLAEHEPPAPARRPARLPRERGGSRKGSALEPPAAPDTPRRRARGPRGPRGMTTSMKIVFAIALALLGLSIALLRCNEPGKATKAREHWNAPPPVAEVPRQAALVDLIETTRIRADAVVPGAQITRLHARQVGRDGRVDLNYGSADLEFSAQGASPCSVRFAVSWQGTQQRPGGACHDRARPPGCTIDAVLEEAFRGIDGDARAIVDYVDGRWSVRFRDVAGGRTHERPYEREDDCAPP